MTQQKHFSNKCGQYIAVISKKWKQRQNYDDNKVCIELNQMYIYIWSASLMAFICTE